MATLLEHVNTVIEENGIAGGTAITTFSDAEPEISRLINHCIAADYEIQGAWHDWSWMWNTASVTASAGTDEIPLPTIIAEGLSAGAITSVTVPSFPFRDIDRRSMVVRPGTSSAATIPFYPWEQFQIYEVGAKSESDTPGAWSIKPDHTLATSDLIPTGGLEFRYRWYMMPRKIPRHIDAEVRVPSMVVDPDNSVRAGLSRALIELTCMKWARSEGRFEVMAVAAENYKAAMESMRATYGSGQEPHSRMSSEIMAAVMG